MTGILVFALMDFIIKSLVTFVIVKLEKIYKITVVLDLEFI